MTATIALVLAPPGAALADGGAGGNSSGVGGAGGTSNTNTAGSPGARGSGLGGGGGGDQSDIDPIIHGLLARLPKSGDVWPEADRKLWLEPLAGGFKLIYIDAAD